MNRSQIASAGCLTTVGAVAGIFSWESVLIFMVMMRGIHSYSPDERSNPLFYLPQALGLLVPLLVLLGIVGLTSTRLGKRASMLVVTVAYTVSAVSLVLIVTR